MKLTVLTTRLFGSPGSGGEVCTARLLQGLAQAGHELVLVGRGDARAASCWADEVVSVGNVEPPIDEQGTLRRSRAVLGALAAGMPITVHRQGGRAAAALAAPWLSGADAVIVDHLQVWPWLGEHWRRPLMLVQHNVESDNYLRRSCAASRGYQGNPHTHRLMRCVMWREARGLQALELQALHRAAVVACLSESDAQRMAGLALHAGRPASALLEVLPGYPLVTRTARPAGARPGGLPAVGLVGTWTWAPNREGLLWLLSRVWPRLQGHARLVLAGNGLDGLDLPVGTQVLGRVDDVQTFLDAVDLIAVPSLTGSGVQEKAIEAVASGLPVVATPHALRGLGDELPPHVHCASDAEGFAAACRLASAPQAHPGVHAPAAARWTSLRQRLYAEALDRCLRALAAAAQSAPRAAAA
jgi:glycosyltransferase involved in cell wall biosynthesis